jgi:ParB-like chromosome segregation protein Spo0J
VRTPVPESQSLTIEWWTLDRVRPYEHNPRVIPEAAIDKVAASINAFGWRQPLVVDDGVLLAGHTRLQATMRLGLARVPIQGLSPEAARAFRLADNRTPSAKVLIRIRLVVRSGSGQI